MSREWTNSQNRDYPYKADDGREELTGDDTRTLRGGAFGYDGVVVRCAVRVQPT